MWPRSSGWWGQRQGPTPECSDIWPHNSPLVSPFNPIRLPWTWAWNVWVLFLSGPSPKFKVVSKPTTWDPRPFPVTVPFTGHRVSWPKDLKKETQSCVEKEGEKRWEISSKKRPAGDGWAGEWVLTWGMSGLRRSVLWVRRKPPRPRPERPRRSRIRVAQTRGGLWARQRCR